MKKVKLNLTTATYKDYVRHFGVKEGARRWKRKESPASVVSKPKKVTPQIEDLEPIQKAVLGGENQDIRKTESDILECGTSIVELISKPAWNRWLKPQIQKDMVDFVMKATMTSGETRDEAMGGYKYSKKLLKTIDKWIQDYVFIVKREEKKQNASIVQ